VQKYLQLALKVIHDIHSRNKVPVVCGGTNYYIEAVMFEQPPK
jgi:tRNA dimethylallyltransferase